MTISTSNLRKFVGGEIVWRDTLHQTHLCYPIRAIRIVQTKYGPALFVRSEGGQRSIRVRLDHFVKFEEENDTLRLHYYMAGRFIVLRNQAQAKHQPAA